MILKLYSVNDGDNVINKTLNNPVEIEVNLRKDFDKYNPVFFLEGSDSGSYDSFNYCTLEDLGFNYFINSVEFYNSKVSKLVCSCDVLETYKNDILNSNAQFYRGIKTGDYIDVELDLSTQRIISKFNSDAELIKDSSMVMVTIEG